MLTAEKAAPLKKYQAGSFLPASLGSTVVAGAGDFSDVPVGCLTAVGVWLSSFVEEEAW
jgi:hypothetical protein